MTDYVRIATLDNDVEGALLDSILTEEGIPHVVTSYRDSVYDGLFQMSQGWGCVEGPADQADTILTLLDGLRSRQEPSPDDGEEP